MNISAPFGATVSDYCSGISTSSPSDELSQAMALVFPMDFFGPDWPPCLLDAVVLVSPSAGSSPSLSKGWKITQINHHSLLISIENPPHLWVKQKLEHDLPIKLMAFQTNHQETMTTDCGLKEIGTLNEKNRIKLKGHVKNSNNLSYVRLPSTVTCMAVSINNIPYSSD